MLKYEQKFIDLLEEKDIKYTPKENVVDLLWGGQNAESIHLLMCFDPEDKPLVQVVGVDIVSFKEEEQRAAAVIACNELNAQYRWAKFYLNDAGAIIAEADAILTDTDGAEIAVELMYRVVNIIDEAYKILMRVKLDL